MDKSRVEPTIFFIEKISFLLKLFSGHFMGNPSLRLSEVLIFFKKSFQEYHHSVKQFNPDQAGSKLSTRLPADGIVGKKLKVLLRIRANSVMYL